MEDSTEEIEKILDCLSSGEHCSILTSMPNSTPWMHALQSSSTIGSCLFRKAVSQNHSGGKISIQCLDGECIPLTLWEKNA